MRAAVLRDLKNAVSSFLEFREVIRSWISRTKAAVTSRSRGELEFRAFIGSRNNASRQGAWNEALYPGLPSKDVRETFTRVALRSPRPLYSFRVSLEPRLPEYIPALLWPPILVLMDFAAFEVLFEYSGRVIIRLPSFEVFA